MIHGVKCIGEVQVTAEEPLPAFCRFLDGPMQALHLPLRGVQPAETLLRGIQQAVSLGQPIQAIRDDRRQNLVCCVQEAHWAVARNVKDSILLQKEANQSAHPGPRRGRLPG